MTLDIILFSVSLTVYAFLLYHYSRNAVKLQHALLAVTAATVIWGVLFGVLNLLFVGALLYYIGALAGLLFSVLRPKIRAELIPAVRSFPVLAFLFGCAFFAVLFSIKEPFFMSWDEFSHWGPFAKNAKMLGSLHIFSHKEFVHPPYYQGMTVFYYIGSFFSSAYAEADMYAVYCVFYVACAVSVFPNIQWKKSPVLCATCLLATPLMFTILPYANYAAPYTCVYLDALVGVFFGAVLTYIIQTRHENTSIWTMTVTAILLFAFFQIKDIAFAFCLICIATYALQLLMNKEARRRPRVFLIAFLLIVVLPLLGRQIWSVALTLTGNESGQFTGISVSGLLEIIRSDIAGESTYFTEVFRAFLYGLWHVEVVWTKISIPFVALILFAISTAFGVFVWKKERDITILIHALLFVLYFFCYLTLLLVIYLCAMSPGEALSNASMDRYMACFFAGWCVLLISWSFSFFERYCKPATVCVPTCLLLAALILFPQSMYAQNRKESSAPTLYKAEIAALMEAIPSESNVWLVQYGENPNEVFEKYIFKYLLMPNATRYEMPMNVMSYNYAEMMDYARRMSMDYIAVIRDTEAFWEAYGKDISQSNVCAKGEDYILIKVS